jgi:hypothetical protein
MPADVTCEVNGLTQVLEEEQQPESIVAALTELESQTMDTINSPTAAEEEVIIETVEQIITSVTADQKKKHDYLNIEEACQMLTAGHDYVTAENVVPGCWGPGMHDARDYVNLINEPKERFFAEMRGAGDYVNFPTDPFLELECDLMNFGPETSHEDPIGDTQLKTMEIERRRIIETQTVKMKYIDSWIKSTEAESLIIDSEEELPRPRKLEDSKVAEFEQMATPSAPESGRSKSREIKRGQMVKSSRPGKKHAGEWKKKIKVLFLLVYPRNALVYVIQRYIVEKTLSARGAVMLTGEYYGGK